jgi:aspartate racemase
MTEPKITAQHIGIIGCSAEGAALCYRTVCASGPALMGPYGHPEVSLHTPSFSAYVDCLNRGDWAGVAELMLASANKLARIGADFLVCPDNTIHQALPQVAPRSPLPWLHIAEVVADEAVRRGFHRLGLAGTRWLVAGPVYADAFATRGLELVRPTDAEREDVNRIIMDELVHGEFRPESTAYFQKLIQRFGEDGCDAVVLGCTEIPLIITDANSPLPTLDSTRLLAQAAVRRAVDGASVPLASARFRPAAVIGRPDNERHLSGS